MSSGKNVPVPNPHGSLVMDLGQKGSGRRLSKRETLVSVGSAATSIPAATISHLPAHPSMPHPCTRSEMNAAEEGSQPGFDSTWTHECIHRWCLGPLYPERPHLLQQSPPERQTTLKGKGTRFNPTLRAFDSNR